MNGLRALLTLIFVAILGYTGVVAGRHGMGLVPIFFGDIAKLTWPGQFNFADRHGFWGEVRFGAHGGRAVPTHG